MTKIPNPYKALGVSEQATPGEIKKAYRELAKRYHPDRNPGDTQAEERFKEVSEANDILSDSDKKAAYDLKMAEALAYQIQKDRERKKRAKDAATKNISGMFGGPQPTASASTSSSASSTSQQRAQEAAAAQSRREEEARRQAKEAAEARAQAAQKRREEQQQVQEAQERRESQEVKERAQREAAEQRVAQTSRAGKVWAVVAVMLTIGIAVVVSLPNHDGINPHFAAAIAAAQSNASRIVPGRSEAGKTGAIANIRGSSYFSEEHCESEYQEAQYWTVAAQAGDYLQITWEGNVLLGLWSQQTDHILTAGAFTQSTTNEATFKVPASGVYGIVFGSCKHSTPYTFTVHVEAPAEENSGVEVATSGSSSAASPTPTSVSLPKQASESFDVTPAFESAGSISKDETWPQKRMLTLNAQLEGFLLKVVVNITYSATTASEVKAYAKEDTEEELSLEQIVARTEAHVKFWNSAHEDERDEIYPVSVHLKQHGLQVYGTITYPAALPGEYEWGSGDEEYKLGTVTTPSLGHAESYVVFKEHRAANNTVLLVGMIPNALEEGDGSLHDVSIAPEVGGGSIHPNHVTTYRSWHRYFLAVLTFPMSSSRIGHGSFSCPSGDESVPLTSSEE